MEYETLKPEQESSLITNRLVGLERDHLNIALDLELAGPGENPDGERRLDLIEENITKLRARRKDIDAVATAAKEKRKGGK